MALHVGVYFCQFEGLVQEGVRRWEHLEDSFYRQYRLDSLGKNRPRAGNEKIGGLKEETLCTRSREPAAPIYSIEREPACPNNGMHGPGHLDRKTGVNSDKQYHHVRPSPPFFFLFWHAIIGHQNDSKNKTLQMRLPAVSSSREWASRLLFLLSLDIVLARQSAQ